MILDRIRDLADAIISVERSIGYRVFKRYVFLGILIVAIFNFKYIATETVAFVMSISEEIHSRKMDIRDEYMTELTPLLVELRVKAGADRSLYFEYHNSEENLDGVPFKFFDLVTGSCEFDTEPVSSNDYRNINSGMYVEFFNDLKKKKSLVCKGDHDYEFREKYIGIYERIKKTDGSHYQIFINVPGVKKPVGFIVLEWLNREPVNSQFDEVVVDRINELGIYYATKRR